MTDTVSIETADLQRREAMDTKPQDRYTGRRKFTMCRQCGSDFGMWGICREVLARMPYSAQYVRWHREAGNDEYLFCICAVCNQDGIIPPSGFTEMTADEVRAWLDADPMTPDYAALAAEEPVTAGQDSRESAGM